MKVLCVFKFVSGGCVDVFLSAKSDSKNEAGGNLAGEGVAGVTLVFVAGEYVAGVTEVLLCGLLLLDRSMVLSFGLVWLLNVVVSSLLVWVVLWLDVDWAFGWV